MTQQEAQKAFQDELLQWQTDTPFQPKAEFPVFDDTESIFGFDFEQLVTGAFLHLTPAQLKISIEDFEKIALSKHDGYSVLSMFNILNILMNSSANTLDITMEEYIQVQKWLHIVMEELKDINKPFAEALKEKYDALIEAPKPMNDKLRGVKQPKKAKRVPLPQ